MNRHAIEREDVLPMAEYARVRDERRRRVAAIKAHRRLAVGPDITFYFENFETMLHQVHEMLHVEQGGEAQLEDELRAYNPLVPNGRELIATMMIEIEDADRRDRTLRELGGIETSVEIVVGGQTIRAVPEGEEERTTPDGKTSSVHFFKFPFTSEQIAAFRQADARVILAVTHDRYHHMAVMPQAMRAALVLDFD